MKAIIAVASLSSILLVGAIYLAINTHISGFARINVTIGDDPMTDTIDAGQLGALGDIHLNKRSEGKK